MSITKCLIQVTPTPTCDSCHSGGNPWLLMTSLSWMVRLNLTLTREGVMTDNLNAASAQYPYTAVCEVVSTFSDGTVEQGSGVFVSANDVLTASHMLWQTDHGGAAVSVTVYPGTDGGSQPFGAESGAQWHYYEINDHNNQISQSDSQYDVGL